MKPRGTKAELRGENERLRAENEQLRAENARLREEVEALQERVTELEQRKRGRAVVVKPSRPPREGTKRPRKARAAEHNTSRVRMEPTRVERHALERCPECRYRLSGESVKARRQVIDLPEPQPVEVVEHQVIKRWCPHCGTYRWPRLELGGLVVGRRRLGLRVCSLVAYLRTELRMTVRGIQQYLEVVHGLRLSVGGIEGLVQGVGQALEGALDELRAAVRASRVVHCDETGWREDGQNGYIWVWATDGAGAVRYYEYHRSRGHQVPQHILGLGYAGWVVSDFYSAYNLLTGCHQRCWAHLLGDLRALKEEYTAAGGSVPAGAVEAWANAVRGVYDEAQAWLREHPAATRGERAEVYRGWYERLCELGQQYAPVKGHACRALARRLLRHQDELLQFVLVPGVPADNNLAERSLRPVVIMRKISGGTRSPAGSRTRLGLASLFATWRARHLNPFRACLAALQRATANAPP